MWIKEKTKRERRGRERKKEKEGVRMKSDREYEKYDFIATSLKSEIFCSWLIVFFSIREQFQGIQFCCG